METGSLALGVTAADLRAYVAGRELRPYDRLGLHLSDADMNPQRSVQRMLAEGCVVDGVHIPRVTPPVEWEAGNRSVAVHLHSWDAVEELVAGYSVGGDTDCWRVVLEHAWAWIEEFQVPLLKAEHWQPEDLDSLVRPVMSSAWYDMAVGLRCCRLAFILDVQARQPGVEDSELETWWASLRFHLLLLSRDHFFRGHTNHGVYQALGQLAASLRLLGLPGMADARELAEARLLGVLRAHFCADGVHREHSPDYHYMLMGTLVNAQRFGLLPPMAVDLLARVEDVFTWMVTPKLRVVTIGDSDPRHLARSLSTAACYTNDKARWVISGGKIGRPPELGVWSGLESGYAFARLCAAGDVERRFETAAYLAQIAGFHSRVHKHADHLSFVWCDGGRDILVDPGRYGYLGLTARDSDLFRQGFWYADPKRVYCETTRAHNTVEVDGRSHHRRTTPWGSALVCASEVGGRAVTVCDMVEEGVRHQRQIVMEPGRFLLVLDWLQDRRSLPHECRQWFHFAPEWEVRRGSGGLWATAPAQAGRPETVLRAVSLSPSVAIEEVVRGQEEPELLGWVSDRAFSLTPASCFCVAGKGAAVRFATLFVFGSRVDVDTCQTALGDGPGVGRVAWTDAQGECYVSCAEGGKAC